MTKRTKENGRNAANIAFRSAQMKPNKMKNEEKAVVVEYEHTPPKPADFHKYAKLFPMIYDEALDTMREDIRIHGIREPIVFLDGAILDGRNRYMCARDLGQEYPRVEYDGDDPLGFVISHNLHRRHLDASQRSMVAAKLAKMPAHRPKKGASLHPSAEQAAIILNVSKRSVKTAKKVEREGTPGLVDAVLKGDVSVSLAAQAVELPEDVQKEALAEDDGKARQESVKAAVKAAKKPSRKNPRYKPDPVLEEIIRFTVHCCEVAACDVQKLIAWTGEDGIKLRMCKAAVEAKENVDALFAELEKTDATGEGVCLIEIRAQT